MNSNPFDLYQLMMTQILKSDPDSICKQYLEEILSFWVEKIQEEIVRTGEYQVRATENIILIKNALSKKE